MVTIPTIDQISGSTVMNKMRSLINAFINFANEVDTALTVTIPEYVDDALASYYTQTEINDMLDNYYTKSEVYTKTDVYTKSEVNNLLDDALSHYYTQTQTNTLLSGKADTFILHEPLFFDTDLQDNKYIYLKRGNGITVDQLDGGKLIANIDGDTIQFDSDGKMYCSVEGASYTAGSGISIDVNNEISFKGFVKITDSPVTYIKDHMCYDKNIILSYDNNYFIAPRKGSLSSKMNSSAYIRLDRIGDVDNGINNHSDLAYLTYNNSLTPIINFVKIYASSYNDISISSYSAYDLDGTVINSSNIDTYISSNLIVKPFILSLGDNTSANILVPSSSNIAKIEIPINDTNRGYGTRMYLVTINNIYGLIKNNTSFTTNVCNYSIKVKTPSISSMNVYSED